MKKLATPSPYRTSDVLYYEYILTCVLGIVSKKSSTTHPHALSLVGVALGMD